MSYYIAMDAGGTKAETILFDETGHILLRDISAGCTAMDIGADETVRRVSAALRRVAQHIPAGRPDSAFCGVSSVIYYKDLVTGPLNALFPDWPVTWEDDGPGMISSVLDQKDGGCMVCGTGCSLFLRARGELYHIGGLGYLIDTHGSGYWLGQQALLAALKYREERGKQTVLYELIKQQMGKNPEDAIPDIYAGGRAYIASFARCVFTGCKMGDAVSRDIFDRGAQALATLTWTAEKHAGQPFDVVLSGGIFLRYPEYVEAVIQKGSPRMRLLQAEVPPVFGCVKEAVWRHGGTVDDAFKARFLREYNEICQK